jgi:[acyl-carrier-protein] S-malonyltransferase
VLAFVFPGQGSQAVGMGKAMSEAFDVARQTFEEADEALDTPLSRMCFEGPEEVLKRTEITQPALLTASIACARAFEHCRPDLVPKLRAGHSLGEWTALVDAGSISLADGVRSVRVRGRFMQQAVPEGIGSMAAVLGLSKEQVLEVLARIDQADAMVRAANYNAPEQIVISGHAAAVADASKALLEAGARKVMPLHVSAPFHSPLMEPAGAALSAVLAQITIAPPSSPIVSNVTAEPNADPGSVRALLVSQVSSPVRWVECVEKMAELGVTEAIEFGPGKVLTGLGRRIAKGIKFHAVETPDGLSKVSEALPAA